jgi:hypothetical protein
MIRFVGSHYVYQGEQLIDPEIIYVQDHHYNEQQQCYPLEQLLENSAGDHVVIFDHVLQHNDHLDKYNLIFFPSFLARECQEFNQQHIQPKWNNRSKIFNFMINKPRPHRELLLRLIDEYKLTDYSYSLAWKSNSINDIPVTDYRFGAEVVMDRGVKNGSFRNANTYQGLLQTQVFEPACVSLITEPAFIERETIVTEKTLMSVWAGTIPIWVGGWQIPNYLKSIGFDVFDDIVNHSYQTLDNPVDRCRQAMELNLDLLTNLEQAQQVNQQCQARFKKNLELLEQNIFQTVCQEQIAQTTSPVKDALVQILNEFLGLTDHK